MSELTLFRIDGHVASEIKGDSVKVERSLQALIERNSEVFLGVSFLASEYSTGRTHGGRIDTLGVDENGSPVIIEYKRTSNDEVINQGLFYLNWLMDHRVEFERLVANKLGEKRAETIDWNAPRLICIAGTFTKYQQHAVQQIGRNVDLIRYRSFGAELLALQLVDRLGEDASSFEPEDPVRDRTPRRVGDKPFEDVIRDADEPVAQAFAELDAFLRSLGDDVQDKQLKLYKVYRRIKNFACVVAQKKALIVYLKVDPSTVSLVEGFTRDVREIGHWGTGELEVTIRTKEDVRKAEALIGQSYEAS